LILSSELTTEYNQFSIIQYITRGTTGIRGTTKQLPLHNISSKEMTEDILGFFVSEFVWTQVGQPNNITKHYIAGFICLSINVYTFILVRLNNDMWNLTSMNVYTQYLNDHEIYGIKKHNISMIMRYTLKKT